MRQTKSVVLALATVLACFMAAPIVQANCAQCQLHYGKQKDVFFNKAHFVIKNKKELGLSKEQIKQIKELKLETKKSVLRQKADIEILALDLKSQLKEDKPNAESIHQLIDQKHALKASKAKTLADAYLKFKEILSDDQKEKLGELFAQKRDKHHN